MRFLLALLTSFGLGTAANGQLLITSPTSVTENFNSMSLSNSLPTGWRIAYGNSNPSWQSSPAAVTYNASSGTPTSNGSYAWGNSQRTDFAVGMLSPVSTRTSVMLFALNVSGQGFNTWNISYAAEQFYRNNADTSANFYYSLNGETWTQVSSGTLSLLGSNSPVGFLFDDPVTRTKSFKFSTPTIEQSTPVFFRWEFAVTGPQGQGWGFDDISITPSFVPVPEPSGLIFASFALFGAYFARRRLWRTSTTNQD